ncbi:hypothetical protein FH972_023679 [Carpinus fangiana]|uniref:Small ribosomal subunit protein uS10 domain-containing protein n=1 Tax=Carpinus fangiana TaxID=176857 RepID=A0A5N6KYB9_9ROSI|nr:hypothetical protein FH972_023679 [Carpinus fangiana]
MASSKSMQSTCNCFKRLRVIPSLHHTITANHLTYPLEKISHLSPATQPASRTLHTTTTTPSTTDPDAPKTRTTPSPLLPLRNSIDDPPNKHNPPQQQIARALKALARERGVPLPAPLQPLATDAAADLRLPRAVQALYLAPLRRTPSHGVPVANLQLRSHSARNLEFMADFALRAAYYLGLPARGPVPLPRITQRWTMPRDVFIFKKSQENWERVTLRRLIQIQDGHPEVVQRWLAFVRKWSWYGVGMKANVWEHEGMDVVSRMDKGSESAMQAGMEGTEWDLIGRRKGLESASEVGKLLSRKGFGPVGGAQADSKKPSQKVAQKVSA